MGAELPNAIQASAQVEMMQRLAQAELVISGVASAPRRYVAPQAAAAATAPRRISEHDPDWWVSTVTVETVEKGVNPDKTKDVLFPNSRDIAWYRSPKIKEGDRGVWLLHNRDYRGKAVPGHAVTHPLDFRPIEELNRVRSLLK